MHKYAGQGLNLCHNCDSARSLTSRPSKGHEAQHEGDSTIQIWGNLCTHTPKEKKKEKKNEKLNTLEKKKKRTHGTSYYGGELYNGITTLENWPVPMTPKLPLLYIQKCS